jgi:outer membrane protein assembly factor BamB
MVQRLGCQRGICAVLGLPEGREAAFVTELAQGNELVLFFQSPEAAEVAQVRSAAEKAGLLGQRLFVAEGNYQRVHLADNLADGAIVSKSAAQIVKDSELLRVMRPQARTVLPDRMLEKPVADGVDSWSHVFHGPDNNPQSLDRVARAPYLTQFLAGPLFVPMPEVSVAAGGRVFRAFGHISHKANQNAMLNTLICASVYNGTILWTRPLPEGFMIHRNTMVATPEALYLADHRSCKVLKAGTGELMDEIVVPAGIADGPVWKWMALLDGVLYALAGGAEVPVSTQPSTVRGLGHWPWGMWEGHEYKDPKTNFGFGRTFFAMDPATKKVLWSHREDEHVDARGVCMDRARIFYYSPEKFLGCLDASQGRVLWRNDDRDLLAAIGPNERAQHYVTGYATTTYMKCHQDYLFFSGPQRQRLVVARATDGTLLWTKEHGNFLLVLREDGVYAAGPQEPGKGADSPTGYKFAYEDGAVLAELPMRRACTRATGSVDSVFYRAAEGTMRIGTADRSVHHIAPMRPPCQDGVIISDGMLLWGPWMCGCNLSLYGHIGLAPAGDFSFRPGSDDSRLVSLSDTTNVTPLPVTAQDWPTFQGDNGRSSRTATAIPASPTQQWSLDISAQGFPTAPIAAGGLVFCGDHQGRVWAVRARDGALQWKAHTGGAILVAPAVADGRLFAGSADGHVYAYEAATGRPLWRFRAAPADRWIPVYGKLMSTWPVAGGVVVQDGVVYAAAGIAHYDGTHVFALDAATGKVKWYNDSSGTTSPEMDHGVSLQGELSIRNGELRFVAGSVHEEARFDLATGKCLNEPVNVPSSGFPSAYYPYYPEYGPYTSLDCRLPDGRLLCYDASYEGSWQSQLSLLPADVAAAQPRKPLARWGLQRRGQPPQGLWQKRQVQWFRGFAVHDSALVATGDEQPDAQGKHFLEALAMADGSTLWYQELPGRAVRGGVAINGTGQIFVTLENGQLLAFAQK